MFSIDQNCHSLWDVLPKLQALAAQGHHVHHFVEDIDVAFTSLGARIDDPLRLAPERYYPGGGADWGAALFYSEFLGRVPLDIKQFEPLIGMKLSAAARKLGQTLDELYEQYSPSDNWQLIGPSYIGDKDHHRVVGDLTTAETAPFIRQLMDISRANCLKSFPQADSQARLNEWFDCETARVEKLLTPRDDARLVDVYRDWMEGYLDGDATFDLTSDLFACGADKSRTELMEWFCRDYEMTSGLYNQAIEETSTGLRPLEISAGELPFFATLRYNGHIVRAGVFLQGDKIVIGQREYQLLPDSRLPIDELIAAGVLCLAGKALLLVIQARMGPNSMPLALPIDGSLYMPAAYCLQKKFTDANVLTEPLKPVVRVGFELLERMAETDCVIRLPEHLTASFGKAELPAREFAENWADRMMASAETLGTLANYADEGHRTWADIHQTEIQNQITKLDIDCKVLAQNDPKSPQLRELSHTKRKLEAEILEGMIKQIDIDTQVAKIDYWNSRGAILPWCIGLGGMEFYNDVIAQANIYEEY